VVKLVDAVEVRIVAAAMIAAVADDVAIAHHLQSGYCTAF
jgi:hypothetical protein